MADLLSVSAATVITRAQAIDHLEWAIAEGAEFVDVRYVWAAVAGCEWTRWFVGMPPVMRPSAPIELHHVVTEGRAMLMADAIKALAG